MTTLSRRHIAWAAGGVVVSAAGLWLVVRGIEPGRTLETLQHVTPGPLLVAGAALAIQLWVRCLRWSRLIPTTGRSISAGRLLPVVLIGYLGNAVLPARLGDPLRAVIVGRREHVQASSALGSVVLERAVDTLTLSLLVLPALALTHAPAWLLGTALVAAGIAGSLLLIAQTRLPILFIGGLRRRTVRTDESLSARWLDRAVLLAATLDITGRRRRFGAAVGLSIVAWLLDGAVYWSAGAALGLDISPAAAMLISAITVLGTAIPSAPGYLGVFELVAASMAQALGVHVDSALAFAILAHAVTVLPLALGGLASLIWLGVPARRAVRAVTVP